MKFTVRCVACKHETTVGEEQRDTPFCEKCGSPMVAVSVSHRTR